MRTKITGWLGAGLIALAGLAASLPVQAGDWMPLFDGKSLDGWTPKIRGYALGENYADTFRVEDGAITVSFDGYESFDGRFGHLFYKTPFSHYRLRFEYRIYGEPADGIPEWAFRNSGVMFHSPSPATMPPEQDFPVSLEFQLLGGRGDGEPRPTGNLCTPGTNVVYQGKFDETHCIESSAPTIDGDDWVKGELLVLGDEKIVHYINGKAVLEYTRPTYGGGAVSGFDPAVLHDGEPVTSGYISLQAEGHPIQFRNIELMDLGGPPKHVDAAHIDRALKGVVGEFFWDGAANTLFWVDPVNDITAVRFNIYRPWGKVDMQKAFRDAVYYRDAVATSLIAPPAGPDSRGLAD